MKTDAAVIAILKRERDDLHESVERLQAEVRGYKGLVSELSDARSLIKALEKCLVMAVNEGGK